jgi:hypothetical protein
MKSIKRMMSAASLGAFVIGVGLSVLPAHAAYVVTLTQEVIGGVNDVVANGSGAIDLTGLSFKFDSTEVSGIAPSSGQIGTGIGLTSLPVAVLDYGGFTGPPSFGSGGITFASSGSGDQVGILVVSGDLQVPFGYVSGHTLSDTATYDNATFASLGVTPGVYTWTWGSALNGDADSFTLKVVAPTGVPEPSTWAVMLVGFAVLGFAAFRASCKGAAFAA